MRSVICALALLALPTSAFAGDFDILRGTMPTIHWGGVYGGVQGGYSSSDMDFSGGVGPLVADVLRSSSLANDVSDWAVLGSISTARVNYGGFVGYNTEWEDVIIGFEANYNRLSLSGASSSSISRIFIDNTAAPPNTSYQYDMTVTGSSSIRLTDVATFRVRAGWEAGRFLPYAFGGLAVGRADVAQTASVSGTRTDLVQDPIIGPLCGGSPLPACSVSAVGGLGSQSNAQQGMFAYGFTAGIGMDVALLSNVFARAEWEYVGFAPIDGTHVAINSARVGAGIKF
jgi:outer membrane immunogenic protein